MRRKTLAFLSAILPCASCASVRTPNVLGHVSKPAGPATGSTASARKVFNSKLVPVSPGSRPGDWAGSAAKAWGSGRILLRDDDSFEYVITIYNPGGATFTSAHLHRSAETEEGPAIATLFSDLSLSGPYIQLRGTITMGRATTSGLLAEEMRETPSAFTVSVHSTNNPRGVIRGTIE